EMDALDVGALRARGRHPRVRELREEIRHGTRPGSERGRARREARERLAGDPRPPPRRARMARAGSADARGLCGRFDGVRARPHQASALASARGGLARARRIAARVEAVRKRAVSSTPMTAFPETFNLADYFLFDRLNEGFADTVALRFGARSW